jgi:glutaconate CoA-transferase subunit A
LVLTPDIKVAAVVHEPFGAYPSPVQGCYRRHHDFFGRFHEESRTVEGNRAWLDRFIHGVDDWPGFLAVVGADVLDTIRIARHLPSDPLDYGA